MTPDWPFADPENAATYTLDRILRGEAPILRVRHDCDDGAWQFLDGGDVDVASAKIVSLRAMVELDPSLRELADLPKGWGAERDAPGLPWRRSSIHGADEDEDRDFVAGIEEHGWRVVLIPEDEEGPGFAYSVGLFRTFGHPEIILLGLDLDLMHGLIDNMGEDVRNGASFTPGRRVEDVLEGYPVEFREVSRRRYRDYLGYAGWFYGDEDFPVVQCVWPDMEGRFPDDPDAPDSLREAQPLLQG